MGIMSERVARGAELLDRVLPGWEAKIDPNRLSIRTTTNCVLGQCFGSYDRGVDVTMTDDGRAVHFGFSLPPVVFADRNSVTVMAPDWTELDAEWRRFLQERSLVGLA